VWKTAGLEVVLADFTGVPVPKREDQGATLVLANPPYVRHHHLGRERKASLRARAEAETGASVCGLAGLYVYFMLFADRWMADNGVGAWLVPTEWMDVNYGSALKEYLTRGVHLLRVHRFDPSDVQFGDALVSSSVVFFRKERPGSAATCEMTVGDLTSPRCSHQFLLEDLRGAAKWSPLFSPTGATTNGAANVRLADLLDVRRGVATGGNEFFVRPLAEFRGMGVPDAFLRPILPSSRLLDGDTIERGPGGYPDIPTPLAWLDCRLPESRVRSEYPRLWDYLESPLGQKVRTGYLTRSRRPWYSQEQRPHAPVVATYMGRGRRGDMPFRFFWNKSDATATNVYLLLIPRGPLASLLSREPERAREIAVFLAGIDPAVLLAHGRVYGGGLHKLEPRELGRLDATRLVEQFGLGEMKRGWATQPGTGFPGFRTEQADNTLQTPRSPLRRPGRPRA
jgi:hypothetical protein